MFVASAWLHTRADELSDCSEALWLVANGLRQQHLELKCLFNFNPGIRTVTTLDKRVRWVGGAKTAKLQLRVPNVTIETLLGELLDQSDIRVFCACAS